MEKLANALFSMRGMAVGMLIFFVAIARATFIESNETTQAAKLWVYNALWFELLLVFLAINLVANIMRYKMWMREKIAMLMFHISFIVIIIGAGVTRYFGFEGRMEIPEGQAVNKIMTAEPYVYFHVNDGTKYQYRDSVVKYMAESYPNSVNFATQLPGHTPVKVEYVDFKSKHIDSLVIDMKSNKKALDIVLDGMQSNYVMPGEDLNLGGAILYFSNSGDPGIHIFEQGDSLVIRATIPMQSIAMSQLQKSQQSGAPISDSLYNSIVPNTLYKLNPRTLYSFMGKQFVFKQAIPHAKKELLPSGRKDRGYDFLTLKVTDAGKSKIVRMKGGIDAVGQPTIFSFNGLNYAISYGLRFRPLPFDVKCEDFIMDKYPGSQIASSYASDIVIQDKKNGVEKKKHLFMNHVVDHNGYRFFQSSYFPDETGTILSVNSDWWGTNITYLGYLLMIIGMIMSLFAKAGRLRELIRRFGKHGATAAVMLFVSAFSFAQETEHDHEGHNHDGHDHTHHVVAEKPNSAEMERQEREAAKVVRFISVEHSEELSSLLVQDYQGRNIPFHTMCNNLLVKIYGKNSYEGYNAVQVIMSMHMYPLYWNNQKMIKVHAAVQNPLKLAKYVSFNELSNKYPDGSMEYKYLDKYKEALRLSEAKQNEFQKKLIKLTERYEIIVGIQSASYLRIIPVRNAENHTWYPPTSQEAVQGAESTAKIAFEYFGWLYENLGKTSDYQVPNGKLKDLKSIQRTITPADKLPSETQVKLEISYNKMQIFKNAEMLYFLLGTFLLILYYIKLLARPKKERIFKIIRGIFVFGMIVSFLYHGYGLGIRSYISGHAPWSDGYEALVFIAWVAVLLGLIFMKRIPVILALAALLAGSIIMVTQLELLDPQITPLQPVLKSYWLKVHVAVITSSYAFLGLSCILGLTNLVLLVCRNMKNAKELNKDINDLTHASEILMMIGTFMLTIGTFLGGIWANESWGRYWGWDPKETWALASVLVYAIILHFRFIPGLKSKFAFNVASFFGYAAILFTFFGVNFILVGLHSYAQGDGAVSLPTYIWYMLALFIVLAVIAGIKGNRYNRKMKELL